MRFSCRGVFFVWSQFERKVLFLFGYLDFVSEIIMKVKPSKTLDCIGLYCPEPVYKTRMELDNMKIGEVLEVVADDPAAEADIRTLVKHLEQEIVGITQEENAVRILIRKMK